MTSIKSCGAKGNSSIQSILNKNSDNHTRENTLVFCSFYRKRYEIPVGSVMAFKLSSFVSSNLAFSITHAHIETHTHNSSLLKYTTRKKDHFRIQV